MLERSYLRNTFVVSDPDARLRRADNLMAFEKSGGEIKKISEGLVIRVDSVQRVRTGAKKVALFAHAIQENGEPIGWTSTKNLDGWFVNETLEVLKPAVGSGKFGPNAAWSDGAYVGQIELLEIVDSNMEIERLFYRNRPTVSENGEQGGVFRRDNRPQ